MVDIKDIIDYVWALFGAVLGWLHYRIAGVESEVRNTAKEYVRKDDYLRSQEDTKALIKDVKSDVKDIGMKIDKMYELVNTKADKE